MQMSLQKRSLMMILEYLDVGVKIDYFVQKKPMLSCC